MTNPTYIPAEQLEPGWYSATIHNRRIAVQIQDVDGELLIYREGDFASVVSKTVLFTDFLPLDLTASVPELRERIAELELALKKIRMLVPSDGRKMDHERQGWLCAHVIDMVDAALAASREVGK